MEQAGQAPIVLYKEVNGFVLNRMQYALMAEAFRYAIRPHVVISQR